MVQVRSTWAENTIIPGGVLGSTEWSGAGIIPIPAGFLMVKNDAQYVYIALDMVADRGQDPGTGDYFWFTVDVDGNGQITPRTDTQYSIYRGQPNRIGRQLYLGPGRWTGLGHETPSSRAHIGFGRSPNSAVNHRVWELRLPLDEAGVDLNDFDTLPKISFGVRVSSTNPRFTFNYPNNFYNDFSNLHQILLARSPGYPAGTPGVVFGGVGLVPATEITDGYATTDPSYYIHADEAAFGGRMHLIGNRTTLQSLWTSGARKYKIQHRFGTAGAFTPIRQTWTNYRWDGTTYVLENFGPDSDDTYPLLNPSEDYSIDDLLLQWRSYGFPAGLHQFRAEFLRADDTGVRSPRQTLTLMLDNNIPHVDIVNILHDGTPVPPCALEYMTSNTDGLKFRITVNDAEGHLRYYRLAAHYGDGQPPITITSDSYPSHRNPAHQWNGVTNALVPPAEWVPPITCAYQFRLSARPRVINGYTYIGYTESTSHVTLIKPPLIPIIPIRSSLELPYGLVTKSRLEEDGTEPKELGDQTIKDK